MSAIALTQILPERGRRDKTSLRNNPIFREVQNLTFLVQGFMYTPVHYNNSYDLFLAVEVHRVI